MGTRNLTCVVLDGEYRIAQYGQWDGYPSGQGETVLAFLRKADLDKFRERVRRVRHLTLDEANAALRDGGMGNKANPISRDMGAGILAHVLKAKAPAVYSRIDFAADSLFCEWAYVVDLDTNALEVYRGFNQAPLTPADRFYALEAKAEGEYHPIKLFARIPFADLTKKTMADLEEKDNAEAEMADQLEALGNSP